MPSFVPAPLATLLAVCCALLACGGTSVRPGDDAAGRAGMSGAGAGAGTGGTATGGDSGSGGSSAGGGGRAGGGGGGVAGGGGAERCETNQPCSVEGETCSLPEECCPCVLTCTEGVWGQINCPACPIECPVAVPPDAAPCSLCEVPSQCEWDLRPVDGPLLSGSCLDGHWLVEPKGAMPTCCTSDAQCAPNACVSGTCLPRIEAQCWGDEQCGKGEFCSGSSVCVCDGVCGAPNRPGVCVPEGMDCCRDDSGCDSANECVAGVCKERSPAGCWRDADCTQLGAVCNSPRVCPCGSSCNFGDQSGGCVIPL